MIDIEITLPRDQITKKLTTIGNRTTFYSQKQPKLHTCN